MNSTRRKLYIENILSQKCKKIVQNILNELSLDGTMCKIGEADIKESLTPEERQELKAILSNHGFILLDEEETQLIERTIVLIHEMVFLVKEVNKINFSQDLAEKLGYDYNYLANLFSRIKGITLENYIIATKIERVKELLINDNFKLKEISYKLEFSSVAQLSTQFKKVTGMTPSNFKRLTSSGSVNRNS